MRWLPMLALLGGCFMLQTRPTRAVRIYPPHEYRTWWREMEQCTGRRADLDDWTFRVVPREFLTLRYTQNVDGTLRVYQILARTYEDRRLIVFGAAYMLDSSVVRHEMIHALGVGEHDYRVFVTACRVENDTTILWQDKPTHLPAGLSSSRGGMADTPS